MNGTGDTAYYNYDGSGQRVRKVVVKSSKRTERLYLGGVERYREYSGTTLKLERWTVQIDDIAQVDTLTFDTNPVVSPVPLVRYQYRDHLGSASLETNENGQVISYEEYHPFGTSAYRVAKSGTDLSLKRYRFTGKERDDETGLYYFGVRYYAAWLGRWTSSDPGDFVDGLNLYVYVRNNPVNLVDEEGYMGEPPPDNCPDCPTNGTKSFHYSNDGFIYMLGNDNSTWTRTYTWRSEGEKGTTLAENDSENYTKGPTTPSSNNSIPITTEIPPVNVYTNSGVTFVELINPEIAIVLREDNVTFTQTAINGDTPIVDDFTVNTQLYETTSPGAERAYSNGSILGPNEGFLAQGFTIVDSQIVAGRSSTQTFFIAQDNNNNWTSGFGDPPEDSKFALGGGIPIIINGLPYGKSNAYTDDAPSGLPTVGDPGPNNQRFLQRRSNSGYNSINSAGIGKTIIAYNSDTNMLALISEQHSMGYGGGMSVDQIRDILVSKGYNIAIAMDGSTSSTLIRNQEVITQPDRLRPTNRKNNTIPIGVRFTGH